MDDLNAPRELVERVLCECARFYASPDARTLLAFDRSRDQYLILEEGWDGFRRIHVTFVHVELSEGKFWIQKDGTQDGIATDLLAAGVPRERIVLAFQHPDRRRYGDFAVA